MVTCLKDAEGWDFETAYDCLGMLISAEASRFAFLKESDRLEEEEKVMLRQLIQRGIRHRLCGHPAYGSVRKNGMCY